MWSAHLSLCYFIAAVNSTIIDIPTSKFHRNDRINTIIIDSPPSSMPTNATSEDLSDENYHLYNILKPIGQSLENRKEYYYNPPDDDGNSTKMFELPPIMPSLRKSLKRRLQRKLAMKFFLARQRHLNYFDNFIKSLPLTRPYVNIHSFHKFVDKSGDDPNKVVLGFKRRQSPYFKIIESKRNNIDRVAVKKERLLF